MTTRSSQETALHGLLASGCSLEIREKAVDAALAALQASQPLAAPAEDMACNACLYFLTGDDGPQKDKAFQLCELVTRAASKRGDKLRIRFLVHKLFDMFLDSKHCKTAYRAMLGLVQNLEPVSFSSTQATSEIGHEILDNWVPGLLRAMSSTNCMLCIEIVEALKEKFKLILRTKEYASVGYIARNYYRMGKTLGAGQYASVLLARDIRNGSTVAIKELNLTLLQSKIPLSYIDAEVKIMHKVTHNNVVRLYESYRSEENLLYLVMEYCSGGTLEDYVTRNGKVSETTARQFMRDLAMGLRYLQHKGIVHRDLKPGNLLVKVESDGRLVLKIADFTFARQLDSDQLAGTFCGSPLYMAPEILRGQRYSSMSDLWSVGIILYGLLFNSHPFPARSVEELKGAVTRPLALPKNVTLSKDCQHLLLGLLQHDPAQRISWKGLFEHPFLGLSNSIEDENADQLQRVRDAAEAHAQQLQKQLEFYMNKVKELEQQVQEFQDCGVITTDLDLVLKKMDKLIEERVEVRVSQLELERRAQQLDLQHAHNQEVAALRKQSLEKDQEIATLHKQSLEKDQEIANLKQIISALDN